MNDCSKKRDGGCEKVNFRLEKVNGSSEKVNFRWENVNLGDEKVNGFQNDRGFH
ncbi:hypothetical protein FB1_29440 [Flavobacterium branchiophilum NBRC 15030 = ATCC 35035]|nr:hypothetical protein FB1_29440 [Flavobacterium branchiophilum NBRC 15030 = ATCC 35035]